MKTYEVTYIQGIEKKTIIISGNNEGDAGKKFSEKVPNVSSEEILSVIDIEKKEKVQKSSIRDAMLSVAFLIVGFVMFFKSLNSYDNEQLIEYISYLSFGIAIIFAWTGISGYLSTRKS